MKITAIEAFPVRLPLRRPLAISGGVVGDMASGAPHVYVRVTASDGSVGWGEARPSPRWSYETLESVVTTIRRYIAPALLGQSVLSTTELLRAMDAEIAPGPCGGQPIAKAAIDTAVHDLLARCQRVPLCALWGTPPSAAICLSYLISTRDAADAEAMAKVAREAGYQGIDLKIGFGLKVDEALLEAVAPYAKDLFFRVDANQAYTLPEAIALARRLGRLGVSVFEQPLAALDWLGHAELRRKVDVPVALDEGIWDATMLLQAIRLEACDAVVVKLTKMGGLARARRCGELAREAGLGLLGGGLTESSLGLVASAHLFHALGIEDPVDLNGPFFLADDPMDRKPVVIDGAAQLPEGEGLGCTVVMERLRRFAVAPEPM